MINVILAYGVETRVDTIKTKQILETAEMRTLRKFEGKTLRDQVKSENIRARCNSKNRRFDTS